MSEVLKKFRTLQTIRISFRRKGFMFIEPDGYLSLIMVRPNQRRKGLGAAMLRYAKRLYPHLYAIPIGDESEKLFAIKGGANDMVISRRSFM
jgi:GNAT superfamily N-acetyltransferase